PRGDEGAGGIGDVADADRRTGAARAAAARGGEQFAGRDVDRRAGLELAVDERGDRHGVPGQPVQEVRRAVERIGDEDEPARGADAVLHSLRRVRRAHYVRGMARIFSGIQPSGELHIGNYLGAVKNWVALQHTAESIFCIVDYHAIITAYEPAQLRVRRHEM